jgi:hypothetical protein
MNPRASSGLKKRCKHRGIKPSLRVRRPRVAEALALRRRRSVAEAMERKRQAFGGRWEAQALREGGLNINN